MTRTDAKSSRAEAAKTLIESLQLNLVNKLQGVSKTVGQGLSFQPIEWLRDDGRHGGGIRFVAPDGDIFNRASVNMSQIHYDDDSSKSLGSATALSTIVHPKNPYAPSMHMHISWTELKSGKGYWRIMADLNPAIEDESLRTAFISCLQNAAPKHYKLAAQQGDRYFFIPALERHRGVAHFYLEEYSSDDALADYELSKKVGESVIDCYANLLKIQLQNNPKPVQDSYSKQLAYHTLYFFQVLTLDRGTTSGLLIHDQNDAGVLGSLPSHIDKALLQSWQTKLISPQDQLLQRLVNALPDPSPSLIDDTVKLALAKQVRMHYQAFPAALDLQASGGIIPATVDNHGPSPT